MTTREHCDKDALHVLSPEEVLHGTDSTTEWHYIRWT